MSNPKTATNPRGAGRKPSGLPTRVRRNLNIQRDVEFDKYLVEAQEILAVLRSVSDVSQSDAVRVAITYYAISARMAKDQGQTMCSRCNGLGYLSIRNGDDDQPCPECAK